MSGSVLHRRGSLPAWVSCAWRAAGDLLPWHKPAKGGRMMTAAHLLKGFGHLTSWLAVLSGPNHVRYRYLHGVHIQIVTSDISACLKQLVLFSRRALSVAQAVMQRFRGWRSHGVGHHSNPVEQKHGKQEPAPDACEHRSWAWKRFRTSVCVMPSSQNIDCVQIIAPCT